MDRKIIAALLAAGASSRFGSAKQLAAFAGQTLIEHMQSILLTSSVDGVAVIVGCHREAMIAHILPGAASVDNQGWQEGIASSIRQATEYAQLQEASHLLLVVCDQPLVSSCLVDKIVSLAKFEPGKIIACRYGDTVGVPALFPRRYFDALLMLEGDCGAKSIIKNSNNVVLVDFPDGVRDIDCPSDLDEPMNSD